MGGGSDGGGMEGRDGGDEGRDGGDEGRDGGGGSGTGVIIVRRRVVVLFRRVVLPVSSSRVPVDVSSRVPVDVSSRVPVDVSSLSHCFCVGRLSFSGKHLQVVVVFMRGGGRFCVGVRSRSFGVLLVVWAVVLVSGRSSSLYGRSWQPGGGRLSLALGVSPLAIVAAVVVWPLSCVVVWPSVGVLGWIGWDGIGMLTNRRRTTTSSFVVWLPRR